MCSISPQSWKNDSYITKWVEKLNWLRINDRINHYDFLTTFKFVNGEGPNYLSELFQWAPDIIRTLRNGYRKLKYPFRKTTAIQNTFFFKYLKMKQISRMYKKLEQH